MRCARQAGSGLLLVFATLWLVGCADMLPPPATRPPVATPGPAPEAQGRVSGTLTVGDQTTPLSQVYAGQEREAGSGREYLVVLLADRPVAAGDRQPERLSALARGDRLEAVRLVWPSGVDDVRVALYHPRIAQSGLAFRDRSILSISALSEDRIAAEVRSKKLGQLWAFVATFEADLLRGGIAVLEPLAPTGRSTAAAPPGPDAPAAGPVGELAGRGLEFSEEDFFHAIVAGDVEAVRLFLRGGMSPNVTSTPGGSALMMAVSMCTRPPIPAHHDIVLALIQAKADVNVRDGNNSTPLIWAVDKCDPPVIQALVDAGADVNARANGGATPLMLAEVTGRVETAEILRRAGARPWTPGSN
jgi:hypothetical protein